MTALDPQPGAGPIEGGPPLPRARLVLAGSMLVMGVAGMIYEYSLGALGDTLIGSSHEQLFVVIGLMMFAMGVGAAVQRKIAGPLIDRFLQIEIALGVIGGLSGLIVMTAYANMAMYPVVLYGLALLLGLLIGFEVPLLIRINEAYSRSLGTNLGEILSMDYVGSLVGALLFAYVLLSRVELPLVAVGTGVVSVCIGLAGLGYFWRLTRRPRGILLAGLLGLTALGLAGANTDRWVAHLEQAAFADPIVHRERSVYQHIALTERDGRLRMYLNGNLQFSSDDEWIYHEMLVHPAMIAAADAEGSRPRRVLILGGGDGLAMREVLRWPSVDEAVLVDLDEAVTRLARTDSRLVALNDGSLLDARVSSPSAEGIEPGEAEPAVRRVLPPAGFGGTRRVDLGSVRVLHVDADAFLRGAADAAEPFEAQPDRAEPDQAGPVLFDVILCDFPDPRNAALAKLYSVEFYRAARARLAPGGVMAVQSSSPWHAPMVFRSIGATLEAAGFETLPYRALVPQFSDWGWHLAWPGGSGPTGLAAAGSRDAGSVAAAIARGAAGFARVQGFEPRYLTEGTWRAATQFAPGWFEERPGVRPREPEANTKLRPVLIDYYRRSWRR